MEFTTAERRRPINFREYWVLFANPLHEYRDYSSNDYYYSFWTSNSNSYYSETRLIILAITPETRLIMYSSITRVNHPDHMCSRMRASGAPRAPGASSNTRRT